MFRSSLQQNASSAMCQHDVTPRVSPRPVVKHAASEDCAAASATPPVRDASRHIINSSPSKAVHSDEIIDRHAQYDGDDDDDDSSLNVEPCDHHPQRLHRDKDAAYAQPSPGSAHRCPGPRRLPSARRVQERSPSPEVPAPMAVAAALPPARGDESGVADWCRGTLLPHLVHWIWHLLALLTQLASEICEAAATRLFAADAVTVAVGGSGSGADCRCCAGGCSQARWARRSATRDVADARLLKTCQRHADEAACSQRGSTFQYFISPVITVSPSFGTTFGPPRDAAAAGAGSPRCWSCGRCCGCQCESVAKFRKQDGSPTARPHIWAEERKKKKMRLRW